jgi:RHS repeat-associated protein
VDVQTVADSVGKTTRMLRDPYGAPIGSSGVWGSGTGYMNKPASASTGLTTVGARTYDPVLGKFASVDPVIDTNLPQQNTGYTYSGNNPTTYMDPSGLKFAFDRANDTGSAQKWTGNYSTYDVKVPSSPSWWKDKNGINWNSRWKFEKPNVYQPRSNSREVPNYYHPRPDITPIENRDKNPWRPLVEWNPKSKGTIDVGVSACAGVCMNLSLGHDFSGRIGLGFGPEVGVAVSAGAGSESTGGFYLGGSCSASMGPVGGYVEGGIQERGPLGYGGAGITWGAGLGCSADVGWGWDGMK